MSSAGVHFNAEQLEAVKLIQQYLQDLGLQSSASTLASESGIPLESVEITAFRHAVLQASWNEVYPLLDRLLRSSQNSTTMRQDIDIVLGEQEFCDLLHLSPYLAIRRLRDIPVGRSKDYDWKRKLSSSLIVHSSELDLMSTAEPTCANRKTCLSRIQEYLSPAIMLPPNRLEALFSHARKHQQDSCPFHTRDQRFSLLKDHSCTRAAFPSKTDAVLHGHTDEVWNLQWNHAGTKLATASADKLVLIWKVLPSQEITIEHVLRGHSSGV